LALASTIAIDTCGQQDNHLVELGVAGQADYLVTRNIRDLRGGERDVLSSSTLRIAAKRCEAP
jgi:hypothetical protein